jgi:hypothetical protein
VACVAATIPAIPLIPTSIAGCAWTTDNNTLSCCTTSPRTYFLKWYLFLLYHILYYRPPH